jgi:hypothetical protein
VALGREKGEEAVLKMQIQAKVQWTAPRNGASGVSEGGGNCRHVCLPLASEDIKLPGLLYGTNDLQEFKNILGIVEKRGA